MKTNLIRTAGMAAAATTVLLTVGTGAASASTINGTFTPVAVNNGGTVPITVGNSDTNFGVMLQSSTPANGGTNNRPNCSADTATGSTDVFTYLIEAGENPTAVDYTQGNPGVLPDGSPVYVLVDSGGTIETTSDDSETASGTGQINLQPQVAYQWGQLTRLGVPVSGSGGLLYQNNNTSGKWLEGFACFKQGNPGVVTDYWQTPITFTANSTPAGGSQGFTWSTAAVTTTPPAATPEVPLPIVLPLGAVGLVAGGVALSRKRRRSVQA